jgi:neutral ceramidase
MRRFYLFVLLASLWMAVHSTARAADELLAGVAVTDITPPIPFRMSGYFTERLSTSTKDPLQAKAVVFQQGDVAAAFVFCDLVGVPRDLAGAARAQASAATGIPADHIAVSATHSHTGPLYFGALSDFFHQRNVTKLGKDPYDPAPYRAKLVEQIVAAVVDAKESLQPMELKSGHATEDRLSFNRRFHMKDGSVQFNPGQQNPNIIRAAGPIDPQVGIVAVSKPNAEKPSAAIVSFAMHLDTLSGTEYSADYPKYIEDVLRKSFGPDFTLLFGAGTCGDINHVDVTKRERRKTHELGQMLGETVEKAIRQIKLLPIDAPSLAVRSTIVETPLQSYSEDEITQARKNLELVGTRDLPFLGQVEAYKIIDLQRQPGQSVPIEVQVFRLNEDTAIVTLPAEIFVEIGLAIKAASPFKTTLVIELTNDSLGYIPTKKAFAEGSYETVNSRVAPGSGEKLVEAATRLLEELQ